MIDPNPEPTTPLPNVSLFLSQDSLGEKAETQARVAAWRPEVAGTEEQHLFFSYLLVLPFGKKQMPQQPCKQHAINQGQKDAAPSGVRQARPWFPPAEQDFLPQPAGRTRPPASIFAISQHPRPQLQDRSCKYNRLFAVQTRWDGWDLKWLSPHPRVWIGNLV